MRSTSSSLLPRAAALLFALALGACASGPPAPIVPRTGPAAVPVPPPPPAATEAAVVAPPVAAVPEPAVTEPAVAETAPIRSGQIESRPVDPRAATPPGGPGVPGAPPPPLAAPAPLTAPPVAPLPPNARTGPRGTKLPFSESALAELRAAETPTGAARGADPKADARPPDPKAAEAPAAEPAAPAGSGMWGWPGSGRVVQSFDQSNSKGIALSGKPGDPVVAAADGRVIFSGNGPRGYGNLVIVRHANDLLSVYAHNRSLAVKEGQDVKRGQKIAELGDSGTTSPRLHFEIRQQGKPVDPAKFLPRR